MPSPAELRYDVIAFEGGRARVFEKFVGAAGAGSSH